MFDNASVTVLVGDVAEISADGEMVGFSWLAVAAAVTLGVDVDVDCVVGIGDHVIVGDSLGLESTVQAVRSNRRILKQNMRIIYNFLHLS
jgi:hypothetical protein